MKIYVNVEVIDGLLDNKWQLLEFYYAKWAKQWIYLTY